MTTEALDGAADAQPPAAAAPGTVAPPAASQIGAAPRRHAAETVRLYAADWGAFTTWCTGAGLLALPTTPKRWRPSSPQRGKTAPERLAGAPRRSPTAAAKLDFLPLPPILR
jgi:hypothetical protein